MQKTRQWFSFTLKLLYLSSNMSTQLAQNFPINLFVFSSLFVSFRFFAFSLLCETLVTFIELSHNLPAPIEDNQYNTIRNPRSMDKSLEPLKGNYNLDILGRKSQPNAIHGLQWYHLKTCRDPLLNAINANQAFFAFKQNLLNVPLCHLQITTLAMWQKAECIRTTWQSWQSWQCMWKTLAWQYGRSQAWQCIGTTWQCWQCVWTTMAWQCGLSQSWQCIGTTWQSWQCWQCIWTTLAWQCGCSQSWQCMGTPEQWTSYVNQLSRPLSPKYPQLFGKKRAHKVLFLFCPCDYFICEYTLCWGPFVEMRHFRQKTTFSINGSLAWWPIRDIVSICFSTKLPFLLLGALIFWCFTILHFTFLND